ncbi:MAG TPA: hypothetical protein VJ746_02350 [Nitrospira sp.]|nr:hypothetical protein [Nitrospira sp.]
MMRHNGDHHTCSRGAHSFLFHFLATTAVLSCAASCSPTAVDVRHNLDVYRSAVEERAAGDAAVRRRFLSCSAGVAESGDTQDGGSRLVRLLIQQIGERRPDQARSLSALQELSLDLDRSPIRRLDVGALRRIVEAVRDWQGHLASIDEATRSDASRFGRLLSAYTRAYFGDVRYVSEPASPGQESRRVIKPTSGGFVDRGGNTWLFPALSQSSTTSDTAARSAGRTVTSQTVAADLTRVFLEAFFDAAFQVPAMKDATALRVVWPPQEPPYPAFDPDHPVIPGEDLAGVTSRALRAEAAVTAEVGHTVRGAGVFGTGNETLAAAVETAGGVIAKKLVEHEGFCYFRTMKTGPAKNVSSATERESSLHGTEQ